jgi:transcriptional regulator with PAS, ATPase and Fis domain
MPELVSVAGSIVRFRSVVAGLSALVIAAGGYAFHEHNVSKQLTEQNSAVTSTLNATRDQVNALNTKLDAMTAERAADKAETSTHSQPGVYRKPMMAAATRHRIDDPRWKKMQGQLDDQAKQIDATRQDLTSARTELQGSIATTHEELVLLEKKGERSYYEFDLDKSKQFQREGPVGVQLRKSNTKHEYADLDMLIDDLRVSKKHVNIYEPVFFYPADSKTPAELVINKISKDHIHGYISEPKYKGAEVEAKATTSTNIESVNANDPQAATAKPSPGRQRLEPPK